MRMTCQRHDSDSERCEGVSVRERQPLSTQTVTHARRDRENTQITHTQCVWSVKGHLPRAVPQRSRSKVKGQRLKAAVKGQRQHRSNTGAGIDNRTEVWNFFHTPPDRNGLVSISSCDSLCSYGLWWAYHLGPDRFPYQHLQIAAGSDPNRHRCHRRCLQAWRQACGGTHAGSIWRLAVELPTLLLFLRQAAASVMAAFGSQAYGQPVG